jgi:Zn-dependent peptidase ImmA (M78 family)
MGVPRTVQIGPLQWRISTSLADYSALMELESDTNAVGFTHLKSLTISIKPDLPPSLERETVLHELIHAIIATQGGVFATTKDDEMEEAAVSAITPLLLTTLRGNPKVSQYLLET